MDKRSPTIVVDTVLGRLAGVRDGGVVRFPAIPYAEPPVGGLRFAAPQPKAPWTGVLDASQPGPVAPQRPSRLINVVGGFDAAQSEDCLTVAVTTPAADNGARPVLVWLHGGGFTSGGGSLDWYDGTTLAAEGDVVVVGVNYRLGPLGFLCAEGLGDGQAGVQDMVLALRWVRENISRFGGDPGQVTVTGQSAGAQAIMCMLTMPDVHTLFGRAILQSPPAGVAPFSTEKALGHAERLTQLLGHGATTWPKRIATLRSEPAEALLDAAGALARETAVFGAVEPPFFPVVDELADAERFRVAAARGAAAAGIAVLIGTNRDEGRAMAGPVDDHLRQDLDRYISDAAGPKQAELYWSRAASWTPSEILAEAMTDAAFLRGSIQFAETAGDLGAPIWCYQVDWSPYGSPLGACHCIELPLVFGTFSNWSKAPMLAGADPAEVDGLSTLIRGSWLQFANTGNPERTLPWPQYDREQRRTMLYGSRSGIVGDPAGATWRL